MPQYRLVDEASGRWMDVEAPDVPSEEQAKFLWGQYDALKVASTPKGSEERRRAMAQEVAAQQEASTEDLTSQRGRLSSAGQSAMRGGGVASGQSVSMLARIGDVLGRGGLMVGPGGAVPFTDPTLTERVVEASKQTPLEREQDLQQDPLYQAGQSLATGAKLAYQPNPQYKGEFLTDVIPSSAGAMVPTIVTGLVAGPAAAGAQYGLSAGQAAAEEAIAAGRPETAQTASIATLPIGALSEFGLGAAANVGKLARLGAQRGVLVAAGRAAGGEAIQEGVEQVGQNLVASDVAGYDPNRGAFEGVPQAMAAGALLGGVIGGASAKIAQANTTPDLLAGLSEKWKAIGLARELNALAPVGGISQPAPLTQGLLPQAQLDLSAQNAPPQFQMVASEAPRTANPVSRALSEIGLRETLQPEAATQVDRLVSEALFSQPAATQLAQLEQSRQAQFPAGGAAIQPEQPQSILPQGDLMSRLRDARKMDELRQPSPMSAAALGTGQPVGEPPAVADLTPFLQFYENQVQESRPLPDVQGQPAKPQAEAQAPQGVADRQGQAPGQVRSKNVNLRAKVPKSKKSSQTIIGSNGEKAPEMPVQPPAGEAPILSPSKRLEAEVLRGQIEAAREALETKREYRKNAQAQWDEYRTRADGPKPYAQSYLDSVRFTEKEELDAQSELNRLLNIQRELLQPLYRSEPAAAQGVATEGTGTSAPAGVPVFGGRRYGNAPFIDAPTYNAVRAKVDEGLQSGDEVAKRIDYFENAAEVAMGTAAGYSALTQEGQQEAVDGFKRKLYQSAKRWADGGEFKFAPQVIARSMASDIGKSNAEKMRRATTSGESSEEGGVETRGAFETLSQPVLPQVPLQAPVKVKEEVVLTLTYLQRQLNATDGQMRSIIQAYANPDREADLDDAELAMLEQARPMLKRLDSIAYSVSSLIREPIGRSRALQAVDKWKLETGAVGARIEVVEDPNLTTPDGRPVAAMVETRPGELPLITLNAAHIASEQEVREKLWHEALHPVWNDPSVQKAWGDVVNALPRGAVQSELARGYDPLEATMEAAINAASVQANNTPVRTAWQKFLDAVWEALGRVFGFDTKPKDFERLMEGALRSLSRPYNQEGEVRYSVANSFAMAKSPTEIQKRLETSSDPESLLAMGRAVASLITPEFTATLQSLENAAPGTPEATTRSFLKRADQLAKTGEAVVEWAQTHDTPIPAFQSLDDLDPQWRAVVGNAMMGAHFSLGQQMKSIDKAIENASQQLTEASADLMEADEKRLVAESTKSEATRLLNGLLRTIALERNKLGTSSQTLSKQEADDAAKFVSQIKKNKLAVLSKGLETMAREMPIAGFASNSEALAWLKSRQQTAPIFGQDAQDALTALEKALQRQPDLTKRIEQIRALTLDNVDALREVNQLTQLIGKNKANTIKNYAKLRADYESAFRRLKNASSRVETWSNKMDGLLKAKEALGGLMGSPDYTGKLEKVFGDSRALLSGLMAPVLDGGQPNGVVEFYGPSAYRAAGNRVASGQDLANLRNPKTGSIVNFGDPRGENARGTIYRIDWNPEFAIEKKNMEAIDALLMEISEALNIPDSANYITDPLARSSYTQIGTSIAQFMRDNRYLSEQQWADSLLLTGLKGFGVFNGLPGWMMQFMGNSYTTRMNAAIATGGRGGRQWEESNKAVDAFEKKAENTLRDTRTENAVARRAAIQSHGLNPDDQFDVATWAAHISSIIGSQQNPSQDQLKEGDYVGRLKVTKEDLRSASIQKKFSSSVVADFNNMATSFAEVVNPEEEIGGVLFTRAAEDYGMKTARKFSEWGREFSRQWSEAVKADQLEFQARQANANGEEEIPMVWDNREKLADQFIDGPVYSHISETNSEFSGKDSAILKEAFRRIRKDLKAGRVDGLTTVEAIGNAISELSVDSEGVPAIDPISAKEALLAAVERDVDSYNKAVKEFDQSGIGQSTLPDAIINVRQATGALAKARGQMVAPTWFYDYGIHNDHARSFEIANGKRILLMKVYETMTAYRNAVKRSVDEANREIATAAQKIGRNGNPVGYSAAEKEYDKAAKAKYKEGGEFATRKMLVRTLELLDTQLAELKSHLGASSGVATDSMVGKVARGFLGGLRSVLLASVNSILNNLSAIVLDPYRTWTMSNRFWMKLLAPTRALGKAFKFMASDMVSSLPAGLRNQLTKKQRFALTETIASTIRAAIEERILMEKSGQAPTFESYSSIYNRIKANPLSFGNTTEAKEGDGERLAAKLYSRMAFATAFGTYVKERIPGYFDGVINRVLADDARAFTEWLSGRLWEWARNLPGETLANKVQSTIFSTLKAEDIGVTEEGLAQIRDFMSASGSLERFAANVLQANGLEKLGNSQVLTKEALEAIQFDAGRKYNIRASSTTPDITKGGGGTGGIMKSIVHMFMGWVLQRMGVDATQFLKIKGGGWKKELGAAWGIALLMVVSLLSGAILKMPKDAWRFISGNPATTPNILQAITSPEMGIRYLAASTAGVMPVGGEIAAELLGGTGISSPLNNNFLDNNPAAGFAASMLSTAQRIWQTKDLKYPLVDFTRKNFWPAGVVLNYAMPGDVEARGASRAVRMGAAGMEVRPIGGGVGARETPTTPLVRDAVAALYEGDSAGYQKAREKFIAYQIGQGKTQKEAEKRFDSSVSGRDPLRSVLGRTPTEDEEATILRRLTPGQRATVSKARSLFRKPKKIGLGRAKLGRRVRLGRKRPARRRVRLRRAGA